MRDMTIPATRALPLPRREPAAILLGGVQALAVAVVHLLALWTPALTDAVQAAILVATGAVVAAAAAWNTAPSRWALLYGLAQAAIPLAVLLGLELPAGADVAILTVVAAAVAVLTRGRVSPAEIGPPSSLRRREV